LVSSVNDIVLNIKTGSVVDEGYGELNATLGGVWLGVLDRIVVLSLSLSELFVKGAEVDVEGVSVTCSGNWKSLGVESVVSLCSSG